MNSFKSLLIGFLIVVALILTGGYVVYTIQVNSIIEDEYHEIAAIKQLKVKQITDWRKERFGDANAILNNGLIIDEFKKFIIKKDEKTKELLLKWFKTLEESYEYVDILLADKDFNTILSSSNIIQNSTEHLKEFLKRRVDKKVYFSSLHLDDLGHVHYAIKIDIIENNKFYGCLLIQGDPNDFLFPLIQQWPTPSKTAETLIVRQEGDSLLFLNSLRHQPDAALKLKKALSLKTLPAARAINGETGMYRGYDYRGKKVLADIGPIPGTEWFIISKVDEDEIFEGVKTFLIYVIIIILLLLSISYLLFLFLWRASQTSAYKKEMQLQKEKARISNLYATLSQINQAIVREQSRSELVLIIPKLPVKFGNFLSCALALKDSQTDVIKAESFHGTISYFHSILDDDSSYRINDAGVASISEEQTVIWNSISNLEEPWMKEAKKNGIRSCASSTITFLGKTVGSITLYSDEENSFGEAEQKLIEEIASDISFSLEAIDKSEKHKLTEKKVHDHERQLATLFKNLPGIAYRCALDENWTMLFMSEGAKDITGYTAEEFVKDKIISFGAIIAPEDRELVWEKVNEAVKNKTDFTLVYRIIDRSGKTRWVWERGQSVAENGDKDFAIEGFISDITELKEAQEKLVKSEEYFRYLFHNNPLPMWIYDLESQKLLDVNQASIKKYGFSREDFLAKTISDIEAGNQNVYQDISLEKIKSGTSSEFKHKLKNGNVIDVLLISREIEYTGKSAVLCVVLDITDRIRATKTLIEAKEKAEASEKIKTNFLAQMSHEIRTPVNVILSFSSLIKEEVYSKIDDDLKSGFNAIDHAAHRLIRTIDSILNMAQITSGMFEVKLEKINIVEEILIPLRQEFESLASAKNLSFVLETTGDNKLVMGDHYSLSQVFANLIDNSIKYTEKGFVKVIVNDMSDNISVSVKDSGIGISKKYLPDLFSAFSQEETGYSRKYEGTGLGLALVSNYCKLNKAELTVDSKKGSGTTFTVTLPKI